MSDEEKVDKAYQSALLSQAGDEEGSIRLLRSIPMPPYLAKVFKEKVGADFLIDGGYNLSEAEAEFGKDWLTTEYC
jgi:hypothetical protein